MSLWSRTRLLLTVKTSAALDRAEDPRGTLDYACGQQQELLRTVQRGLVEVATSRERLERHSGRLTARLPELERQARQALEAGREDLARAALQRKQAVLAELDGLAGQADEVAEEERRLILAAHRLSAQIEQFRSRRDVMAARYTAAEAQVRVTEALTGVSEEVADVSQALQRAEDKTERMQTRASALTALIEGGSLEVPGGDGVERELQALATGRAVEQELAALRAALHKPEASAPATPQ
jgi:phage shock protein A